VDRLVVKHHVDLARHDDGVVDRARPVHQRIAYWDAARRRLFANYLSALAPIVLQKS
jgi:hypothetical protein